MKALPDVSALIGSLLGGSSSNEPTAVSTETALEETLIVNSPLATDVYLSREDLATEYVEPSKTKKKGKKRSSPDPSPVTNQERSSEAVTGAQSDEPPKKKKTKKMKKKSIEERIKPSEDVGPREIIIEKVLTAMVLTKPAKN